MQTYSIKEIYNWLSNVPDPEVPVLSILDLGIVRNVQVDPENKVTIIITPTYSGCPAMDVIAMQIRMNLISNGVKNINIENRLSPAWTTDWMTEEGKRKLKEYGIAPPQRKSSDSVNLFDEENVPCPRCGSGDTIMTSQFGATSCKSLYKCNSCQEPFEHFKCH